MHHADTDIASIATWELPGETGTIFFAGTVIRNDEAHCSFSDFSTIMEKG
jgi:hypothetical protein